jgi:hypothetical protein
VEFTDADQLMVADRSTRVTKYQLGSLDQVAEFAPKLTAVEMIYYYGVLPVYWLFPKPGELDNTVLYVLEGDETMDLEMNGGDLQAPRAQLRPWSPVRSSLLFVAVLLALACIYIERQDF